METAVSSTVASVCTQPKQNSFTYSFTQLNKRGNNKNIQMWVKTKPGKATVQNGRPMRYESAADDTPDGEMFLYWVEMSILHINLNRKQTWP